MLPKPFSSKQGKWKLLQKNKNYSTVHKNALPFQNTWNTSISLISLCINTPWSSVLCCYTVLIIMLTTDWDGGTILTSPHFSLQSGSPLTVLWDVGQFIGPRQKRSLSVHVNSVTHQSVWSGLGSPMLVSPFQQSLTVTRLTQGTSKPTDGHIMGHKLNDQ